MTALSFLFAVLSPIIVALLRRPTWPKPVVSLLAVVVISAVIPQVRRLTARCHGRLIARFGMAYSPPLALSNSPTFLHGATLSRCVNWSAFDAYPIQLSARPDL